MIATIKLRKIGNSLGFVLPKEVISELNVAEGDTITVTNGPDGMRMTASNPEFSKTMEVFESLNRRYRNTLRELAK